jgi:hypothetical protein
MYVDPNGSTFIGPAERSRGRRRDAGAVGVASKPHVRPDGGR